MKTFCLIDDKHVPLYRILWVADVPHFCGSDECQREGQYEIHLGEGEAVWCDRSQRDAVLAAIETWQQERSA
jgi:hypothetical protein